MFVIAKGFRTHVSLWNLGPFFKENSLLPKELQPFHDKNSLLPNEVIFFPEEFFLFLVQVVFRNILSYSLKTF
jgi:hypothetical protein